ncbi:MAG: PAS domain S-box protein [Betaproteobacteria bacterium]
MNKPLHILIVEDSEDDALLLLRELRRGGYDTVYERVETAESMKAALERKQWDIVISDYLMPKFSGPAALTVLKQGQFDLPFIIVSGNIGEDIAVGAMKAGAHDYIIKGNLARLVPAVERELREAQVRRERNRAEDQLRQSRQKLFETLENMDEGFFTMDRNWRFTYVNTEASRLWGISRGELLGRSLWDVAPGAIGTIFDEQYHEAVRERVPVHFDAISPLLNIWVEVRAYPTEDGLAVYFHDVTDRKQSEEQIARLNRLYSVLSKVNEAIVRINDAEKHYGEVCRIAVQDGAFRMAWIGIADSVTNRVIPVASFGDRGGYLQGITIIAANVPEGKGPTGRAVFEGKYRICSDIERDPMMRPWRDKALSHGFRTSAAFPLRRGTKAVGAFTVYGDRPRSFTNEEIELLSSLADDVSYAIDSLSNEQRRKEAEEHARVTNALLKLFTQKYTRKKYLDAACELLQEWSGCRHVGIRIENRSREIPFESCEGYEAAFLEQESALSLIEDQCICTRVVAGKPEPPDLRAMTPNGSFFSNDTLQFMGELALDQKKRYRGICMDHGFKSLAVIPVQYRENPLGAIHLADEREGMVPLRNVAFLEQLAHIIGEAIYRFGVEDELRQNYDALQKTTELLERIFSTTHMLVAYVDRNFNFIRVNRAYARDDGREPEFFVGKNYFALYPQGNEAVFWNVLKTGEPFFDYERPFEYPEHPERGVTYWDWNLMPVKEADGSVSGLVLTLINVTDRRRAQEELRRVSAYNRSLIESSLDPLVTIGPDGKITDVNAAAEIATGRLRDELIGTVFSDYFTEPEKARAVSQKVFREGKVMDYALEIRHRDGSVTPVLYNASAYRDEQGKVIGVFAAARDITALKKAEEERARLASAVESTAEAVVITEPATGRIQYVNPAFEQITGYSKKEALGRTLHILDSGKQDDAFYEELRTALNRDGVWRGQLVNRKKDGSLYFEDCTLSPVRDASGNIINFVSVKRDATEKLRLESIAESVNTMDNIGYVFSGVRHEIGNPINSAKMSLNVLQHKLDDAPKELVKDYVDRALSEIGRVEQLLKNLRNYNLYETPELENLNLSAFLIKFFQLVTEDFEKKGITILYEVCPDAEWAVADPRALQQVLLNIMTNAADAFGGRDAPTISVTVLKKYGRVLLQVSDNGCGMTEKQQQELFKPFYTSKPHGTGLGLVIVRKTLAKMKGEIDITSLQDQGTTVNIYLPEGKYAAPR